MFDKYASLLYDYTAKYKRSVRVILLFLLVISIPVPFFLNYEISMDKILPQNEVIVRSMDFFRNADIAGKVIVSLELTSQEKNTGDLIREIDKLAGAIDKNFFREITIGISRSEFTKDMDVMFKNLPSILSESDLAQIDSWMNRDYISKKLHDAYLQLLKPEGIFMNQMLRSDPLGMKLFLLERLKSLSSSTGYDVEIKDEHFVSKDGRHAMLIAKSSVSVTDTEGSKKLISSLKKNLQRLPDYISADIISGHGHTVSNERLIKRDITFISIVVVVVMLMMYGFVIRDFNTILIFLIPVAAILFSIDLSYILLGKLSYWVIGLGSTVAGITIDYSTHVYFATRGKNDPAPFVKHVIRPVIFGALTTVAVFIALFFSGIEGYNQLAVFSIICVILSTFISIFVLPHLISSRTGRKSYFMERVVEKIEYRDFSNRFAVLLWIALTLVLAYFSIHVEFEKDIKKIDGTEKDIIQAEERFHEIWGVKKTPAVVVINSKNYKDALELNERIYRDAVEAVGRENFTSMAAFLPSERTGIENAERWRKFWTEERKQGLKKLIQEEGNKYNFSKNAFEPFFASLESDIESIDEPTLKLSERFVQKTGNGYQIISFFPDMKKHVDSINKITQGYPDTYLVSSTILSETLSEEVSADLKLMMWIAAISIIILTFLCFLNLRETLISLIPPLTSVAWLFGLMSISGISINVANMIAGVLAIGLSSDYGIFMTYKSRGGMKTGTVLAITLCTVTTLIGVGVLIFAQHPALSSVGITMVVGVGAGFLSSVFVVPELCRMGKAKKVM